MKREIRSEAITLREERESPGRVQGCLVPLGRIAGDRKELFVSGAPRFPAGGVSLLRGHGGEAIMKFDPVVTPTEVRIDAALPDDAIGRLVSKEIREGVRSSASIEFFSLEEKTTASVREVKSALIDSVALVPKGSYSQARVEVRERATASMFWWAL